MKPLPLLDQEKPIARQGHVLPYFKRSRSFLKWMGISICLGVIVGLAAVAFYSAMRLATAIFLGMLVGYRPPNPGGEGSTQSMSLWETARPWLLPLITALGGLVSGLLVSSLAPEAEGGGQDTAIAAVHQDRPIRLRVPFVKLLASALIIGTGGSAGREGPIAHICAGLGSGLARLFQLDREERRIALVISMGAGIGAIFRAPLGGAILAMEILYQKDLEVTALIPSFITSTIGYSVFGLCFGWQAIFVLPIHLTFTSPPQLLYYILLGILCGLLGRLYAYGFHGTARIFRRLRLSRRIGPALGGLLVGLIGLGLPQILGSSYGWVQISMGPGLLTLPLWLLLLLPFAKILTTSLSIGSGGSGGIFGPGMVIGGMTGALLWRLSYHLLPDLPALPAPFVVIGMMALLGGIAHVPVAMILMVTEMTGDISLLPPAMVAVSISSLLVGKQTIFLHQKDARSDTLSS